MRAGSHQWVNDHNHHFLEYLRGQQLSGNLLSVTYGHQQIEVAMGEHVRKCMRSDMEPYMSKNEQCLVGTWILRWGKPNGLS